MADQDTRYRIMAEDATAAGINAAAARIQRLAGITAKAFNPAVLDGFTKAVDKAAQRTGRTFEQQLAVMERTKAKYGEMGSAADRAGKKADEAHSRALISAKAVREELTSMATRYLSVGAAIETARRSFLGFAEMDDKVRRIAIGMGVMTEEIEKMMPRFRQLSVDSGKSVEEIVDGFRDLKNAANYSVTDTAKAIGNVTMAAQVAGTTVSDMAKAFGAVALNMKIGADQSYQALNIMTDAASKFNLDLDQMVRAAPRLTGMMAEWGYKGEDGVKMMTALLGKIREVEPNTQRAAVSLERLMQGMTSDAMAKQLGMQSGEEMQRAIKGMAAQGKDVMGILMQLADRAQKEGRNVELGLDMFARPAFQRLQRDMEKIPQMQKEIGSNSDSMRDKLSEINKGPTKGINDLINELTNLRDEFGKLLAEMGVPAGLKALADIIKSTRTDLENMVHIFEWIKGGFHGMPHLEGTPKGPGWGGEGMGSVPGGGSGGGMFGSWTTRPLTEQEKAMVERYQELNKEVESTAEKFRKMNFFMGEAGRPRITPASYGGGAFGGGRGGSGLYGPGASGGGYGGFGTGGGGQLGAGGPGAGGGAGALPGMGPKGEPTWDWGGGGKNPTPGNFMNPGGSSSTPTNPSSLSGTSGSGAGPAGDAMAPAGTGTGAAGQTTVVTTKSGAKFRVASEFAPNFKGFLDDYEAAGGKISPSTSGGLSERPRNASYHPLGRAIDVNQTGRNRITGGLPGGIAQEEALAKKWGLRAGSQFSDPDRGHYEVHKRDAAVAALQNNGLGTATQTATTPSQDGAIASGAGSGIKHTFYAPGASGSGGMEGPYATSRPNPSRGGAYLPTTLDDVRAARARGENPDVTLAGDPRRYGQRHALGTIRYRGKDGNMYTLDKVTGHVHDTGGAFKGRMDKLDIAAIDARGMNDASAARQMAGNVVRPGSGAAPWDSDATTQVAGPGARGGFKGVRHLTGKEGTATSGGWQSQLIRSHKRDEDLDTASGKGGKRDEDLDTASGKGLGAARRAREEIEKPIRLNLDTGGPSTTFARASMRREADREVREARHNSMQDIGAALIAFGIFAHGWMAWLATTFTA